jgi:hypothetical protein
MDRQVCLIGHARRLDLTSVIIQRVREIVKKLWGFPGIYCLPLDGFAKKNRRGYNKTDSVRGVS